MQKYLTLEHKNDVLDKYLKQIYPTLNWEEDKVVFVVDRVELNTQSLEEYNSFSRDGLKSVFGLNFIIGKKLELII